MEDVQSSNMDYLEPTGFTPWSPLHSTLHHACSSKCGVILLAHHVSAPYINLPTLGFTV
jgi:hypothetical protein